MPIPTLRSKNQVTIPQEIINQIGLHVGEPLIFTVEQDTILIKPYSPQRDEEDWLTDEVMAEIEQAGNEKPGPGYDSADDMIAALRRG